MNNVNLIGRLTRDPELRYAITGTPITRFTVAVNRKLSREKRQELEVQGKPTADFIMCQAFGNTAELIANYFSKGNLIGLEGSIQTGSYKNNEGRTVFTTDVIVNSIDFIETKNINNNLPANNNTNSSNNAGSMQDSGFFPIDEKDIPF